MPKVVYYKDESEAHLWRYRVIADNNEIVHASHKGWTFLTDAYSNLCTTLRHIGGETFHESSDGWRWHMTIPLEGASSEVLSKSHESFTTRESCEHNIEVLARLNPDDLITSRMAVVES